MARHRGPDWLAEFAAPINETVRRLEAIEFVRQMVRQWYQEDLESERRVDEWKRDRDAHGKRLTQEAVLRQRNSVPPEVEKADEYWIFLGEFSYEDNGERKRAAGWVPVALLNEPCDAFPLPVTDRVLSMPEKYAVAVAVHDVVLAFDPINPWHDSPPWWEHEDKKHIPGTTFEVLQTMVHGLQDTDRLAIKTIVDAVLADLRKRSDARQFQIDDPGAQTGDHVARAEVPSLTVDSGKREALWNAVPLSINQTSTFDVLRSLYQSVGEVVTYKDLLGVIKPSCAAASVEISEAPPELKPIISRIRAAFGSVGCDWTIRAVRRVGYQLLPSCNKK